MKIKRLIAVYKAYALEDSHTDMSLLRSLIPETYKRFHGGRE